MFRTSKLNKLRQSEYELKHLPGSIFVRAADGLASATRPIENATLDEVAFAIIQAEYSYNAAGNRLYALRRLYHLVRKAGGVGSDLALDIAFASKER